MSRQHAQYTMFLNVYLQGSTPNHNTGYNDSQLVVPEHGHYQEDLSESSNSSSVESSPRGMDPELNNTWVEEETTPYTFSKYPPAVVSSGQNMAPQTATLQSSGADFFDHYFNGQTNTEQTDVGEQVSYLITCTHVVVSFLFQVYVVCFLLHVVTFFQFIHSQ